MSGMPYTLDMDNAKKEIADLVTDLRSQSREIGAPIMGPDDGAAAIAGWYSDAASMGDGVLIEMIDRLGADALAVEWERQAEDDARETA